MQFAFFKQHMVVFLQFVEGIFRSHFLIAVAMCVSAVAGMCFRYWLCKGLQLSLFCASAVAASIQILCVVQPGSSSSSCSFVDGTPSMWLYVFMMISTSDTSCLTLHETLQQF